LLAGHECVQAGVLFAARCASLQVRSHAGNLLVGARTSDLQLDISVQVLEALLAVQLRSGGPEQASQGSIDVGSRAIAHRSFPPASG
jgi:hypothetical protein